MLSYHHHNVGVLLLCWSLCFASDISQEGLGPLTSSFMKNMELAARLRDPLDGYADPRNFSEVPEKCRELLKYFGKAASNFTNCVITNARPVTICNECVTMLSDLRNSYNAIANDEEHNCQNQLLNRDRLMVVQSEYEYLNSMWAKGRCDNCFIVEHVNGTDKYILCNDTVEYYEKWNDVTTCINRTTSEGTNMSAVCRVCEPKYVALNRYYESLNTKYNNLLCMDVMDLMNITRHQWTKTYHCVMFDFDGLPVFIVSAIMALVPIIFYVGNRIFSNVKDTRLMQQKRLSFVNSSFSSSVQR